MSSSQPDIVKLQLSVAIARDQQAYKTLFKYFYTSLISFGTSIVRSREAAEEIYSDIMLKMWDLGPALTSIDNLKIYLFISVKNASLNYLEKYYKIKMVDIETIDLKLQDVKTPEEDLLSSEFQRTLAQAIRSLPAKSQLVYKLIKEEGLSYKQVADVLEISVNTVEGHMSTALKKLSTWLSTYHNRRE